ncbi:MAG: nucleotide exchange factor GrpE [archaeon]|nr:nucleotide exchange factor GrpE [archaeon]
MTGKSKDKSKTDVTSDATEETKTETVEVPKEEDALAKALADAQTYLDMARRIQAEFENYRKRTEREMEEFKKFATSNLCKELVNIPDDLEKALSTAKDPEDPFTVGVSSVRGNLVKILESQGVREVPVDGGFDPNMHEALMVVEAEEDGRIAQVYQKGYMMNGRVLRTAKVVVTKKKEEPETPVQEEKTAEENQ